jgi:GNAT superfamily N-acetyltransferase
MIFHDANGRTIQIEGDYDIEAFHDGKRIGYVEFDDRDGETCLWGVNVDAAYQNAGIGTQMMRLAAQVHGPSFAKPSFLATGGGLASADSYYTQEGASLIARCIRLGILEDTESRDDYEDTE